MINKELNKDNVMEYLREVVQIKKNMVNAVKAGMYDCVAANRELDFRWNTYRRCETFFGLETYIDSMKYVWVDSLVFKYLEDFRVERGSAAFTYNCSIEVDGFTVYACVSKEELKSWGVDIDEKRIS